MLKCFQQRIVVPCLPLQPVVARLNRRNVLPATQEVAVKPYG
jgi:hypothetical protein